jgi:AraC-like DNA-binding protein
MIEDDKGNVGLALTYDESLNDILDFLRCRDNIMMTNWLHDLWGGRFPFTCVDTATMVPTDGGFDYGVPVTFNPYASRWYWPRALLNATPAYADPMLHRNYMAQCEALAWATPMCAAPSVSGQPSDRLLRQIMSIVERSERLDWTLDEMASELLTSRRSLQRWLTIRRVSFRMILDAIRNRVAQRLLSQEAPSITEIASQLGYTDSSSFHRAFVRWTRMSPGAFRRQYLAVGNPDTVVCDSPCAELAPEISDLRAYLTATRLPRKPC